MSRPPDDQDATKDIARELLRTEVELASINGAAYNWLTNPKYRARVDWIEAGHASVQAAALEPTRAPRLDEKHRGWEEPRES